MIPFIAGFAYGITNVIVGQPLDTIKTRMQAMSQSQHTGMITTAQTILKKEGLTGLYRGGVPMVLGGGLIRSTQFGVYNKTLALLREHNVLDKPISFIRPDVVLAGLFGGFCRGVVEGPIEFMKVRRQVAHSWRFSEMMSGTGTTVFRNSFLFSSFVIYIDISKQVIPGGLGSFLTGAICANLAWLTIWPLDVVKSQRQSGNYKDQSSIQLILHLFKEGQMYRGLVPGLCRSALANGCSMVAYDHAVTYLESKRYFGST